GFPHRQHGHNCMGNAEPGFGIAPLRLTSIGNRSAHAHLTVKGYHIRLIFAHIRPCFTWFVASEPEPDLSSLRDDEPYLFSLSTTESNCSSDPYSNVIFPRPPRSWMRTRIPNRPSSSRSRARTLGSPGRRSGSGLGPVGVIHSWTFCSVWRTESASFTTRSVILSTRSSESSISSALAWPMVRLPAEICACTA